MKDYYAILGVSRNASPHEIKTAYKKLSIKFHPDKNAGDLFFEERFKDVQEAYETLAHPLKRANYNAELEPRSAREHLEQIDTNIPIISVFNVSKKSIREGEPITLRWQTTHADKVNIEHVGNVPVSGTKTIRLPMIYDKEKVRIRITATNSFIEERIQKEIYIKNKSFKNRQVHLLYEHNLEEESIEKEPIVSSVKEPSPKINEEKEALKEKTIAPTNTPNESVAQKEEPKTDLKEEWQKKKSLEDYLDARESETNELTKEERLSGVKKVIEQNEQPEKDPGFRWSDVYIYVVLILLLIFITIMSIFVYNMNPF